MPHIHEKIDFTVEVYIVHKNKVLLRMHDKFKIWCSVGGHIELDEDPIEAACREVKEEVGLDIKITGHTNKLNNSEFEYRELITPRFLGRHKVTDVHDHVMFVYFATSDTDVVAESINEHEMAETRWVSMAELDTMDLLPNISFYAKEALRELS